MTISMLVTGAAQAQRALGVDVSYWQGEITQNAWNYASNSDDRVYAFVRATRGGTTGLGQTSGTPGGGSQETLSRRYDDPRFIQNVVRATNAGLMTGPYHFARPDILSNTGADEADHFMQMAGIYMRPGYMLPMYDLEAGQVERTQQELAQFSLDFSNRIYEVMKIRPSIYANGNYMNDLSGASAATRNALAQPSPNAPSMVSPAFPVLFTARYPAGSGEPYFGDIQNENPKDAGSTLTWFFGPFDDYGNPQPWHFWQYSSGEAPFGGFGDTTTDGDISQGDIEFVRDTLVPAVWWNDTSGDWSTMTNWNSGQPVVAPVPGAGQATPYASGPLPVSRLPGAAGSGPTSGQYDTVILERPTSNITVTVSTGTHNVRKMYMREALNITGGSLTINYNPNYDNDFDNDDNTNYPNALRSGPISAQFSGPVSLSGGSLTAHTIQLDAGQVLTLAGGSFTVDTLNLITNANTKVAVTGDVAINPLNGATATIKRSGAAGPTFDLSGGTRNINVGDGGADVDLSIAIPIANGGLTKSGPGTLRLDATNTFAGAVTVEQGTLRLGHSSGLSNTTAVTIQNGGTLDLNGVTDTVASLAGSLGGNVQQGSVALTVSAAAGTTTFGGAINGTGAFTKSGGSTQVLSGNNTMGGVTLSGGTLLFNGNSTTGAINVNAGVLGGTGAVSGNVTVNSGGTLAPGASIESLGVGGLTLNAGSNLNMELGAPGVSDSLTIAGQLAINGGNLNFTNAGGMSFGPYLLAMFGTLSGNAANLNISGPAGYSLEVSRVSNLLLLNVGLPGDFNDDGMVDLSDHILLRKSLGTMTNLTNDNNLGGVIGDAHYTMWRTNYGRVESSGGAGSSVPEPSTAILGLVAMLACGLRRVRLA